VEGLEDALRRTKTTEFLVFANRLTERVRNHTFRKRTVFCFPFLEVLISSELDEKVTAGFEKFQLDFSLLDDLQRLESREVLRKLYSEIAVARLSIRLLYDEDQKRCMAQRLPVQAR
jgi:hypothetical protein